MATAVHDIEDAHANADTPMGRQNQQQQLQRNNVNHKEREQEEAQLTLRTRRKKREEKDGQKEEDDNDEEEDPEVPTTTAATKIDDSHFLPGKGTVFVHTFGCGHNVSDGEYMAGLLQEAGYKITDDFASKPDCYVINSCTVKNPSEDHFVTMLKRARNTGKPVVVAGCVPQGDPKNKEWSDVSVVGVRQIDSVTNVVEEAMRGNVVRALGTSTSLAAATADEKSSRGVGKRSTAPGQRQDDDEGAEDDDDTRSVATTTATSRATSAGAHLEHMPRLDIPKVRRNRFVEIIPINVGCLNFCTYCKTKHARGNLKSWPIADIVARVRQVVNEGVVEIRMTSEDTGAYGIDIGTTVVDLLRAVVKELEGTRVMLRVGMSNPPYLLRQLEDFATVLLHPNVFEFIHIPVQAGSNAILEVMKREYTVEEFRHCCDTFRRIVPKIQIATDIICAFPGEGETEWMETYNLCKELKFPVLNISRFYARRGTPAAAMQQVPTHISKERTQSLTKLYNDYDNGYDKLLIGSVHECWLIETAHDKHHLVGHTKEFIQVLVDPAKAKMGEYVRVKIVSASKYSVKGEVLEVLGDSSSASFVQGRGVVPPAVGASPNQDDQPTTTNAPATEVRSSSPAAPTSSSSSSSSLLTVVAISAAAIAVVGAVSFVLARRAAGGGKTSL